ncbi:tetratricopeptide repeat protein [Alkalihalobacterium alkalicellulosilyticum]|uniref:tetratricopeptide repeat protein n=1 Tax=Alkalihalobacterium alkalicellulosilyticum TaxID=1912214 RepID=UPI00148364C4|nr:DnaJ domain-containing protein [Bacillus alkalicellulosilyticus]
MRETDNYYEILQVSETATAQEVKRAYYKMVRIYPNETHPEQFKILTKAYKTLFDDNKRAEYDRSQRDDGVYQELQQQVLDEYDRENYYSALSLLQEMNRRYPDDDSVKENIGYCELELKRYDDARRTLMNLYMNNAQNEYVTQLLARLFFEKRDFQKAKSFLRKLIDINPGEANYYLRLSNIHVDLKEYYDAINILEQKFSYSKETPQELPLLTELFFLTDIVDNKQHHQRIVHRIKNVATNQRDKESVMSNLIDICIDIQSDHPGYAELVSIIKDINKGANREVSAWLRDAEASVRQNRNYNNHQPRQQPSYNRQETAATTYSQPIADESRGSIAVAIILGIILSFIGTPILGIIGGFLWYFYAEKILNILGCLVLIIIAIGILAAIL